MSRLIPHLPISRRAVLSGSGAVLAAAAFGSLAFAQRRGKGPSEVSVEELMKPPADLPDLILGSADAKVTVVEYASMTCSHCADFHNKVFPDFKTKYIDTGKVRFVFRDFPLDPRAAAASMLARCAGGEKTHELISTLFKRQEDWAFERGTPVPKLLEVTGSAGFTEESIKKCLNDKATLEKINQARTRASEKFGVSSTPTFFINGKRLEGRTDAIATFDQALEPLLKT